MAFWIRTSVLGCIAGLLAPAYFLTAAAQAADTRGTLKNIRPNRPAGKTTPKSPKKGSVAKPKAASRPVRPEAKKPVAVRPPEVVQPKPEGPAVLTVSALGQTPYRTISAALQKATPGTRIRVEPGVYSESLVLDKTVELEPAKFDLPCVIEGVAGPALTMRTVSATVRGFTLRLRADSTARFAVEIPKGRLLLEDCEITGGSDAAVGVSGSETTPYLNHCRIHKGLKDGALVAEKANPTFTDCTFINNTKAGARVTTGALPVFQGCVFQKNQLQGAMLSGSGAAVFSKCDFVENVTSGARAEAGGAATFRACNFRSNQYNGLIVVQKSEVTLEDCFLTRNSTGAELAEESTANFRGCRVSEQSAIGLAFRSGSRGTLEKCEIWGQGGHGLLVNQAAPVFKGCTSRNNHGSALQVQNQAAPVFEDGELSHGVDWSAVVVIGNSSPTLRRTKIHSSKHGGVEIVGSKGLLENCEIYEHAWNGLNIGHGADPVIKNCLIRNNGHWGVAVFHDARGTLDGIETRANPRGGLDKHHNGNPLIRASRLQ